jgi:hypothetical protein
MAGHDAGHFFICSRAHVIGPFGNTVLLVARPASRMRWFGLLDRNTDRGRGPCSGSISRKNPQFASLGDRFDYTPRALIATTGSNRRSTVFTRCQESCILPGRRWILTVHCAADQAGWQNDVPSQSK